MTTNERQPRFLTVEQVAEELNVGVPLVRAMLKSGEIRGIQIGGRGLWRIGVVDLDAFIETAYTKTASRVASGEIGEREEPTM